MTKQLNLDRFHALADAYGGVIARWPEKHRNAALQMADEPDAIAILKEALTLDDGLDSWRVPAPSASLRERVIGDAPVAAKGFVLRARLWWSGVGIAAALAGVAAGTVAVAAVAPVEGSSDSGTSFGDFAG